MHYSESGFSKAAHAEHFAADVRLTFNNAMLYNSPDSDIYHIANDLLQTFETRYALVMAEFEAQ